MTRILGISAFYHDSAAALVLDGRVVAAAQEERWSRTKHDPAFPEAAIRYCLERGNLSLSDLEAVVFHEKPLLKFERLIATYLAIAPEGFELFRASLSEWLGGKAFQKRDLVTSLQRIDARFRSSRLLFAEHHVSHAASAFYPSPFAEAAILTMDGVGEWATTSAAIGRQSDLSMLWEIRFPHSLGLLYSAFTQYLGFKVNSGEYKVMGLAPYGQPRFTKLILDNLVDLRPDGTFRLDCSYFGYCSGFTMINTRFERLLALPARKPESALTQHHFDVAASIQAVTNEAVLRLTRSLAAATGLSDLCLAGGVALNCVANGKILRDGRFKRIWVPPAPGDAGAALGAALAGHYRHFRQERTLTPDADANAGAFLGPDYPDGDIESCLRAFGASFERLSETRILERAVDVLAEKRALGWFQGRMEFGPRALGARSILADARDPEMQRTLNLKVKQRESFRPFAPAVLEEDAAEWFEIEAESPYMSFVVDVAAKQRIAQPANAKTLLLPRSTIPSATHVDYSARVQTVNGKENHLFAKLLKEWKCRTGCPVLLNTSFNVRGEPIVRTPQDAYRCFMSTGIDALAIGGFFLTKEAQPPVHFPSAAALD